MEAEPAERTNHMGQLTMSCDMCRPQLWRAQPALTCTMCWASATGTVLAHLLGLVRVDP